ncbi:MAG TPA: hypothetical protein VLH60_02265, partial [Sedimentisphaerales bacterium]|nr:hypothetical protein [Sedimentisphaerales bacterium]
LALEIGQTFKAEPLRKYLPPSLAYRIRKWLQRTGTRATSKKQLAQLLTQKFEEYVAVSQLKKNEALASVYDGGVVKMDFGPEVDDKLRKAALQWAKKRGLKPVEASLKKSAGSTSYVLYAASGKAELTGLETCKSRIKLSI